MKLENYHIKKLKKELIAAVLSVTVAAVAFSLYTFPVYLGVGFGGLLLGCLVGGLVTFVLTYVMGIDEKDV